ncbi:hypothetical protein AB0H00_01460 [Nocardia sp. NPDC023852]|uniref:hypothetical protein n=1 Tax=Nocardia sp. NPDC023852 TaxID=3154697 RepID=UPI0034095EE2
MATDDAGNRLEDWLHMSGALESMAGDLVPELDDVTFDMSIDALRQLDEYIVDCGYPSWSGEDGSPAQIIARHLGDTLIRVAGGSWEWDPEADPVYFPEGLPFVLPDPSLDLAPFSPTQAISDAYRANDGIQFAGLYRRWERAAKQASKNRPRKPSTKRAINNRPPWWHRSMSDGLVSWVQGRVDAFPGWVESWSPEQKWDFSPDSLSALEQLVRQTTPTEAVLNRDDSYDDFREGAVWYCGEIFRRGINGRWTGIRSKPCIEPLGQQKRTESRQDTSCTPGDALAVALQEPGYLTAHYANCVDVGAWVSKQELEFPAWIARYGTGVTWDFSVVSLDSLALVLFRNFAAARDLEAPEHREFSEGAVWYLGEAVRRYEPPHWRWCYRENEHPIRRFQLWSPYDTAEKFSPYVLLDGMLRRGNPLELRRVLPGAKVQDKDHHRPDLDVAGFDGWAWTGRDWVQQRNAWVNSIAGLLENLRTTYLPRDIVLDFSSESLRRVAEVAVDHPGEQPEFLEGVAAYLGEMLRRAGRGCWTWTDKPMLDFGAIDTVSPMELVRFAREMRDAHILTRVYETRHRTISTDWPTNHSIPDIRPRPTTPRLCDRWLAEREREFPDWVAHFGSGYSWGFSRDSLDALAEVVLRVVSGRQDPFDAIEYAMLLDGATWYLGETMRRVKPSIWDDNLQLSDLQRLRHGGPYCPAQNLRKMLHHGDPTILRREHDWWALDQMRARVEEVTRWRESRRGRRERPYAMHLASWTATCEQRFPTWVERYGGGFTWDFSPESLDSLDVVIRRTTRTPADLLVDGQNAAFLNGAAWYLGEVLCRGKDMHWHYNGRWMMDCYVKKEDSNIWHTPAIELARVFENFGQGVLRRLVFGGEATSPTDGAAIVQPDRMSQWLSERLAAFAGWTAEYAPDGRWDFSRDSLIMVEELVHRVTPTVQQLNAPANSRFHDGATWYIGETFRRGLGGRWSLQRTERNIPHLVNLGPTRTKAAPVILLEVSLEHQPTPRTLLRNHFDNLARGHAAH